VGATRAGVLEVLIVYRLTAEASHKKRVPHGSWDPMFT
jgi:hypothetical protein